MTGQPQHQFSPWFLTAGLLHALVLLALPWPQSGDKAQLHAMPALNIFLTKSDKTDSAPEPKKVKDTLPQPKNHSALSRPPHHVSKPRINSLAQNEARANSTFTETPTEQATILEAKTKLEPPEIPRAHNEVRTLPQRLTANNKTADKTNRQLIQLLHGAINQHKHYPKTALRMAWQGTASVSFLLQQDGQLASLTLTHSSGHHALDQAALQAVQNISPFEPAQQYLQRAQSFKLDVVFNLYN